MKKYLYLIGILLVAVAVYAVNLTNENKELKQTMHAYYTNEMATASAQMTQLSRAVHQAQLFPEGEARANEMHAVWRISNDLRNSIGKLPIHNGVANDMMSYLGRMGDQAKSGAQGDWQAIAKNMNALQEDWNVATSRFFATGSNYDTWADGLLEDEKSPFRTVSTNLKSYQEANFPLTASESDYEKKRDLIHLTDKEVTKEEVVQKIHDLFPSTEGATLTVSMNADDAAYPFYHVQFARGSRLGYADVTLKGGHVLSFLLERPVNDSKVTQQQARDMAADFLREAGYTDVVYAEARENHEAWHFVFTRKVGDALVYPDSIQVKLAKDTGEVLGVNAMEYIQKETLPDTAAKELDLENYFADGVDVEETKLVYTENPGYELVLCYEVIAKLSNQSNETFRVLIDANTHKVVEVEPLV